MKYRAIVYSVQIIILLFFYNCSNSKPDNFGISGNRVVFLEEDSVSLLRNPCMGWGLYDDANGEVQQAEEYWAAQDNAARAFASFFYVRWRWSDMEPEEGKYAWLYNDNFKKLIQGAKDRGLKLCFRVYDNSQDNLRQGTPEYVKKAGAKGYFVTGGGENKWTPYPDDPIFQEKLAKFVTAFAKEYDDPTIVDFIDGFSLGSWGECHGIKLMDETKLIEVFDWYTTLYTSNFKRVIPLLPFDNQVGFETEKTIAIDKKGYGMRRDGLGSMWFGEKEQKITSDMFGRTLLVGESCWWQGSTDDYRPFASDKEHKLETWRDVYELTYKQAVDNHFNTLDLREIVETKGWTERAPDLVQQFIVNAGYRFYPNEISVPGTISNGSNAQIGHIWVNRATGYLPNNNIKWNYKYKPAFALLDETGNAVKIWIDNEAEPSTWLKDADYKYTLSINIDNIPAGKYRWGLAIVDKTLNNTPGIKIAVNKQLDLNGWTILGNVDVR